MNRAHYNMEQEWNSWSHLIAEDLKRLDNRIQACYGAMSTFGAGRADREAYVLPRVVELIGQTVEG